MIVVWANAFCLAPGLGSLSKHHVAGVALERLHAAAAHGLAAALALRDRCGRLVDVVLRDCRRAARALQPGHGAHGRRTLSARGTPAGTCSAGQHYFENYSEVLADKFREGSVVAYIQ